MSVIITKNVQIALDPHDVKDMTPWDLSSLIGLCITRACGGFQEDWALALAEELTRDQPESASLLCNALNEAEGKS